MNKILYFLGHSWLSYPIFAIAFFSIFELISNKLQFSKNKYFKAIQMLSLIFWILFIVILYNYILNNITYSMVADPEKEAGTNIAIIADKIKKGKDSNFMNFNFNLNEFLNSLVDAMSLIMQNAINWLKWK